MIYNKLNKVLSVSSFSYTAPTAVGTGHEVETLGLTFFIQLFLNVFFILSMFFYVFRTFFTSMKLASKWRPSSLKVEWLLDWASWSWERRDGSRICIDIVCLMTISIMSSIEQCVLQWPSVTSKGHVSYWYFNDTDSQNLPIYCMCRVRINSSTLCDKYGTICTFWIPQSNQRTVTVAECLINFPIRR